VVVFLAGAGTGIYEALTHLGKDGPVLVITDEPMPSAAISGPEIGRWKADAAAFGDRYYGAWPDADAVSAVISAEFADDAVYYDPSNGEFGIEGKEAIISACRQFFAAYPDLRPQVTGMYLSADAAAYRLSEDGALELYPFKDGRVARADHWWSTTGLEAWGDGLFAPGLDGAPRLRKIAERYLAAWSSGDGARIAALYSRDATFSDSLLGIRAQGSDAIAELGPKRFGSGSTVTFEIIDLYAQTNGPDPPTEQLPEHGAIIGVGIHYRVTLVSGSRSATIEGLTTFELGTRIGQAFAVDPDGLITREEVFYDADSLVTAGLVP
ncbi:MAG: nuclear transport factor 2 family protein, partial [bacterium]